MGEASKDTKEATPGGGTPGSGAWAEPLERLDTWWQGLEGVLCASVLVVEIASLTLWVTLKGLASDYVPHGNAAGLLCRSLLSMIVLGVVANLATRKSSPRARNIAVSSAMAIGFLVVGKLWVHVGVLWSSNLLNCLQNASVLMLVGGLRGVATRLTLWVALLGASLATSRAKHIHVDVLIRYVPEKLRGPTAALGWFAAAVVCAVAVFGFVDYIGIAEFRIAAMEPCPDDAQKSCDTPTSQKVAALGHEMSGDMFLLGRQASLDVQSLPRVIVGIPYDKWMKASEWNAWLDSADWTAHYDKGAIAALHMDTSDANATRMPQVVVPGTGEEARGLLIRDANLVFPFGLAVICIKFLLRAILVVSGRVHLEPEGAIEEEELAHSHDRDEAAARGVPG